MSLGRDVAFNHHFGGLNGQQKHQICSLSGWLCSSYTCVYLPNLRFNLHHCFRPFKCVGGVLVPNIQADFFIFFYFPSLTEQAAGVYHRESRKGRYQLTYREAKAVCKYEGGKLATYEQLEAARKIGTPTGEHEVIFFRVSRRKPRPS